MISLSRCAPAALVTASLVAAALGAAAPAAATPALTVQPTTTTRVAPLATSPLDGLAVTNADPAQQLQVTLATSVGTVALPDHQNLALSFGNEWSGDASITFSGAPSEINTALATAELTAGDGDTGQTAKLSLTAMTADTDHVYLAPNQHFYEYVEAPAITWTDADLAAQQRTYLGQRGYLATIPNATVNDFISSKIQNAANVWFGAAAYDDPDATYPRVWRWAEGPNESPLAGQVISNCNSTALSQTCSFEDNANLYNSWFPGEPNNSTNESFAVTNWSGSVGGWNDLADYSGGIGGYVVEYGDQTIGTTNGFDGVAETASKVLIADKAGTPTAVSASPSAGSATVSFTAPADNGAAITGYTVTSSPGGATSACTASPCTVTGLTNGTSYSFNVTATNSIGTGDSSAPSDPVTPRTVPGAPTGATATRGNHQATVAFTAPTSDGGSTVTQYTVTSSPGGITASCPTSPCTVTGLTNGTSYTFTVTATNVAGTGNPSAPSDQTTPASTADAPSGVSAVRGNQAAKISFTPPADNGGDTVTNFTVTSSPGGITASCPTSPCTVTGLTNGTSYTFTVHASNSRGDSAESVASNAVVPVGPPTAPTGLHVTSGNGSLTISFTAPSDDGGDAITGYEYGSGGDWFPLTTTGTGPLTATLAGLANGTSYPVQVRARNSARPGAPSVTVYSTPATVPGAPIHPSAGTGHGDVTVTWQAPTSNGGAPITGYLVTAQPGGATCRTDGATRCTFTDLPAGTYRFAVVASNAAGDGSATGLGSGQVSTPSNPVRLSGLPSAPLDLRVIAGDRVLTVTYARPARDNNSRVTGYQVSKDGGRHWSSTTSTRFVFAGVLNGKTFPVVVRAVNANGHGAGSARTVRTRQWFHDLISTRKRKTEHALPTKPTRYHGRIVATRATARSHNGTVAVAAQSLRGRQLQQGQATSLGTDGLFAFDSAMLNAAGKQQVRAMVRSLRYVRSVVCEGYSDFGGRTSHQQALSRQRARALCSALVRAGAHVHMTVRGYGASRPVVIGGSPRERAANRRVVLLVTE